MQINQPPTHTHPPTKPTDHIVSPIQPLPQADGNPTSLTAPLLSMTVLIKTTLHYARKILTTHAAVGFFGQINSSKTQPFSRNDFSSI